MNGGTKNEPAYNQNSCRSSTRRGNRLLTQRLGNQWGQHRQQGPQTAMRTLCWWRRGDLQRRDRRLQHRKGGRRRGKGRNKIRGLFCILVFAGVGDKLDVCINTFEKYPCADATLPQTRIRCGWTRGIGVEFEVNPQFLEVAILKVFTSSSIRTGNSRILTFYIMILV